MDTSRRYYTPRPSNSNAGGIKAKAVVEYSEAAPCGHN